MRIFKEIGKHLLLEAGVFLALGICLLFFPKATTTTIIYVIAGFFLVSGFISIFSFMRNRDQYGNMNHLLLSGSFQVMLALLLFRFSVKVTLLLPIAIGILIVIDSCTNILYALDIRKEGVQSNWLWILFYGILCGIAGVTIVLNPFSGLSLLTTICGILLLILAGGHVAIYLTMANIRNNLLK